MRRIDVTLNEPITSVRQLASSDRVALVPAPAAVVAAQPSTAGRRRTSTGRISATPIIGRRRFASNRALGSCARTSPSGVSVASWSRAIIRSSQARCHRASRPRNRSGGPSMVR